MKKYYFVTSGFGLSDNGFHYLRSGYNYETIDYSEIKEIVIERDKELNNWFFIFMVGLILLMFSIYYFLRLLNLIDYKEAEYVKNVIYIEEIILPVLPFLFGIYCVYSSLKTNTMLKMKTVKGKRTKYSLKEVEQSNALPSLKLFLNDKLKSNL